MPSGFSIKRVSHSLNILLESRGSWYVPRIASSQSLLSHLSVESVELRQAASGNYIIATFLYFTFILDGAGLLVIF